MLKKLSVNKLIEVFLNSSKSTYKSRIEELKGDEIWVATPIVRGNVVLISIGDEITVTYSDESCIYSFVTTVKQRVNTPIPMLLVDRPDEKNIKRVQRRDFVRAPISISLKFGILSQNLKELSNEELTNAFSIDISGGGLKFLTKKIIRQHELIQINLHLKSETLLLFSKVVRIAKSQEEQKKEFYEVGVQFLNISQTEQDKIIKFIFDWQREMRKKGLL